VEKAMDELAGKHVTLTVTGAGPKGDVFKGEFLAYSHPWVHFRSDAGERMAFPVYAVLQVMVDQATTRRR
jgi:hypothetical protein